MNLDSIMTNNLEELVDQPKTNMQSALDKKCTRNHKEHSS